MSLDLLKRKSRVERLRELIDKIKNGVQLSAFDVAVEYGVSVNIVYRDIKTLKDNGYIPENWQFERKERNGEV